ncbi:11203_t:CDS:2 [Ambispora leptoticha]|uniref:Mitochondrial pyruvate carrier n=1 Tax=Ambispora leptoticha TaxID=144679 RepID=A0A9N9F945_9GLOM|nr:11203_t:CDS:2 [Ambispora leptoticha]
MSAAATTTVSTRLQGFWNHPADIIRWSHTLKCFVWSTIKGPKTIHFWAPLMKWGLVIAGLGDLKRPAEKLSVPQQVALTATGLIWARWSTQIIPVNYPLLAVNAFVAGTGIVQLYRIWE